MDFKTLKMLADSFFSEMREPLLVGIENRPELEQRLIWLSEGSLYYHLKGTSMPHGGSPRELAMFESWVRDLDVWRERLKA